MLTVRIEISSLPDGRRHRPTRLQCSTVSKRHSCAPRPTTETPSHPLPTVETQPRGMAYGRQRLPARRESTDFTFHIILLSGGYDELLYRAGVLIVYRHNINNVMASEFTTALIDCTIRRRKRNVCRRIILFAAGHEPILCFNKSANVINVSYIFIEITVHLLFEVNQKLTNPKFFLYSHTLQHVFITQSLIIDVNSSRECKDWM